MSILKVYYSYSVYFYKLSVYLYVLKYNVGEKSKLQLFEIPSQETFSIFSIWPELITFYSTLFLNSIYVALLIWYGHQLKFKNMQN